MSAMTGKEICASLVLFILFSFIASIEGRGFNESRMVTLKEKESSVVPEDIDVQPVAQINPTAKSTDSFSQRIIDCVRSIFPTRKGYRWNWTVTSLTQDPVPNNQPALDETLSPDNKNAQVSKVAIIIGEYQTDDVSTTVLPDDIFTPRSNRMESSTLYQGIGWRNIEKENPSADDYDEGRPVPA